MVERSNLVEAGGSSRWIVLAGQPGDPDMITARQLLTEAGMLVSNRFEPESTLGFDCVYTRTHATGMVAVRILHEYCMKKKTAHSEAHLLEENEVL